jgi:hypothetical protein
VGAAVLLVVTRLSVSSTRAAAAAGTAAAALTGAAQQDQPLQPSVALLTTAAVALLWAPLGAATLSWTATRGTLPLVLRVVSSYKGALATIGEPS